MKTSCFCCCLCAWSCALAWPGRLPAVSLPNERSWKMRLTSFLPGTPRSLWLGSLSAKGPSGAQPSMPGRWLHLRAKVGRALSLPEAPVSPGLAKCVPSFISPYPLKAWSPLWDPGGATLERLLS